MATNTADTATTTRQSLPSRSAQTANKARGAKKNTECRHGCSPAYLTRAASSTARGASRGSRTASPRLTVSLIARRRGALRPASGSRRKRLTLCLSARLQAPATTRTVRGPRGSAFATIPSCSPPGPSWALQGCPFSLLRDPPIHARTCRSSTGFGFWRSTPSRSSSSQSQRVTAWPGRLHPARILPMTCGPSCTSSPSRRS